MQKQHLKLPKLIIYDWDNTLADTADVITRVINRLRADCSKSPLSTSEILSSTGDPDCDWVIELFGKYSNENADKYIEYYNEENFGFEAQLLLGAKDLVEKAAKLNIKQGVVTNKESVIAHGECAELGMRDNFLDFVGRCDVENKKPSPDGVIKIVDQYKKMFNDFIEKDDIWFVGDTMIDMACAGNYGCPGLFVGMPEWITDKYKDYIYFIGNLHNISDLLDELSR
ncbi:HAD family hydrolase [Candidatus Deianiraea vastatrix]|uniref:phosphoglycolate phosphatase n=1 Tax=Candidatus Deianiraea vastatrix TaxID=2163644 RepID=A0A5B8XD46_9RICK|nr:HAD hydrolase-like protein [Candidatus Deianiraea vastatrix]QED23299.1 Phosphoglycolate phosphatase [Candidatus Deianiraea vastatrix]